MFRKAGNMACIALVICMGFFHDHLTIFNTCIYHDCLQMMKGYHRSCINLLLIAKFFNCSMVAGDVMLQGMEE